MTTPPRLGDATPRNYLRGSLLLLLAESPGHGYDLAGRLGELGVHSADPGAIYRALRAMERDALAVSSWQPSVAGPSRRTYHLTAHGAELLEEWVGAVAESARRLCAYVARHPEIIRSRGPF